MCFNFDSTFSKYILVTFSFFIAIFWNAKFT